MSEVKSLRIRPNRRILWAVLFLTLASVLAHFTSCSRVSFKGSTPPSTSPPSADLGEDDSDADNDNDDDDSTDDDTPQMPNPGGPNQPPTPTPPGPKPKTDQFTMRALTDKIDLFFAIDDSSSMEPEIARLGARLEALVQDLERSGLSWQACFTTTHVADNSVNRGLALNWAKHSSSSPGLQILKQGEVGVSSVFRNTLSSIQLGSGIDGKGDEQAIAALRFAIEDRRNQSCFRADADLHVVILSDEDERSCGARCQTQSDEPSIQKWPLKRYTTDSFVQLSSYNRESSLRAAMSSKWPSKKVTAHALVIRQTDRDCWRAQDAAHPAFYGVEYSKLATATGGVIGDICAPDYAAQLRRIAQRALEALKSVTLQCVPVEAPLVTLLPRPDTVAISFEGNKVFFEPALATGTRVTVNYKCP